MRLARASLPCQTPGVTTPSQDLVRAETDRQVLREFFANARLTRAEVAASTGISKPTISQAVRRLAERGLLAEAGPASGGRGRSGTWYALRADAGCALAVDAGPDGVRAELLDLTGERLAEVARPLRAPVAGKALAEALDGVLAEATAASPGSVLAATVGAADPVDQGSGRLVELPGSPFLMGDLDAGAILERHVPGRWLLDNDVNWAALAEREAAGTPGPPELVLIYLGPGIGSGLIMDGRIVRGARGLAGELAQVPVPGPEGTLRLVELPGALGLTRPGTSAIDVARARAMITDPVRREPLLAGLTAAICAVTALLDPGLVLITGPWGRGTGLAEALDARVAAEAGVPAPVREAALGPDAVMIGLRTAALARARAALETH